MKTYSIYLVFLMFFTATSLIAQQTKLVLPASPNQDQPSNYEPIDLTGDSLTLGYLKINSESNDRQVIVTPVNKQQWLQAITKDKAAKSFESFTKSVLYILNDISVGRTGTGNYVRIKGSIYEGDSKGYVQLLKVDTLVTALGARLQSVD